MVIPGSIPNTPCTNTMLPCTLLFVLVDFLRDSVGRWISGVVVRMPTIFVRCRTYPPLRVQTADRAKQQVVGVSASGHGPLLRRDACDVSSRDSLLHAQQHLGHDRREQIQYPCGGFQKKGLLCLRSSGESLFTWTHGSTFLTLDSLREKLVTITRRPIHHI